MAAMSDSHEIVGGWNFLGLRSNWGQSLLGPRNNQGRELGRPENGRPYEKIRKAAPT